MVSSSRLGSPASTPQDQDKEADCETENRTDINHSLPASYVPEESADSTTEQVQGQCMQLSEAQDELQDTTAGILDRPEASPLNDRDIDGALCDYSDEEEVGTIEGSSSAQPAARVSDLSNQQPAAPAASEREIAEIDEEGNITSNGHIRETAALKAASSPVKTRNKGRASVKGGVAPRRRLRKLADKPPTKVKAEPKASTSTFNFPDHLNNSNSSLPERVDLTNSPTPLTEGEGTEVA